MAELDPDLQLPLTIGSGVDGDQRGSSTILTVDERVHPRQAVMRACYQMAAEADFQVSIAGTDELKVEVRPLGDLPVDELLIRLRRELVDFTIRVEVEDRTRELRDLIWRAAFSEAVGHSGDRGP